MLRTTLIVTACFFCLISPARAQEKFPFLAQVLNDDVNIRAGQSTSFEKVGQLAKGQNIIVVDTSYSWYKIKLPVDALSFVSARYINDLGRNVGQVEASRLNIRSGSRLNSSVVGKLQEGDYVRLLSHYSGEEEEEGWYQIEPIDQSYGWVQKEFVSFVSNEIPPPRVVGPPTKNIYVLKRRADAQQAAEEERRRKEREEAKQRALEEEKKSKRSVVGRVKNIQGPPITQDIRHEVVSEGGEVFYLQGYRNIIDWFINQQVQIEGNIRTRTSGDHPVLLVTKIQLVL